MVYLPLLTILPWAAPPSRRGTPEKVPRGVSGCTKVHRGTYPAVPQCTSGCHGYPEAAGYSRVPCVFSRVGDRPTATILYAQFHFLLIFALVFKQNIRPKYAPPRRPNYTLKWKGGEAAPPISFIFTSSRRGIFW